MAYIDVTQPEDATGKLKEIYEELAGSRGKIAEVHKIQSLNPPTIPAHMELYKSVMFRKSPLSRAEREMMAVVASVTNGCEYCREHHLEALKHFWSDEDARAIAEGDFAHAEINELQHALCEYARALTTSPSSESAGGAWTEKLRGLGADDRMILDATLVISYFNFVNRMVLGLGVELEENAGGYRYE